MTKPPNHENLSYSSLCRKDTKFFGKSKEINELNEFKEVFLKLVKFYYWLLAVGWLRRKENLRKLVRLVNLAKILLKFLKFLNLSTINSAQKIAKGCTLRTALC